jgi:hypothetical protein
MSRFVLSVLVSMAIWLVKPVGYAEAREANLAFAAGKSYAVVSGSIVRGDSDAYFFNAGDGQHVSIAITSLEDNAVFELSYKDGGTWISVEEFMDTRSWYGDLPPSQSGQYRITVSGTRGNATYDMFVGIAAAG